MRLVKRLIILLLLIVVGFLGYKIISTINKKANTEERIAKLPAFTFYTLNNIVFANDSLSKNKSTVVIYFNTGCEHCQYETEQIIKHTDQLKHANFLLASVQPINELKKFDSTYHLSSYPFIKLVNDKDNIMRNIFGANTVPTIFIYDTNNRLIKKYTGEVKIEAIVKAIN
ncbi:peroxiredoxin family protein [Niabella ginsengisoli]|uniref:Redoxin domain-containing protein n=1 Tax=Niabella ginsengisoli TaxID=522298 RepID=A0ABS9SIF2_9BACT|nr:thioredoxin fold domain-containing protein [Niabella ginsengisoli]MCH5598137.1 redoxin domain-containing protein [Niabella ginsengisoli]